MMSRRLPISLLLGIILIGAAVYLWREGDFAAQPGAQWATRLERLQTVQGRLTITLQGVTLEQKLWAEPPHLLRTETESGPSGFAGTIVVLNEAEGWVFSRALNMATVVDRGETALADEAGTGSLLERMPTAIVGALQSGAAVHQVGREPILGRGATHLEIVVDANNPSFPPGVLQVWLDDQYGYPLAWRDSQGRELRFTQISFNQPIDAATFVFFPPPGAAVQRVSPSE